MARRRIRRGDTLSGIAQHYEITLNQLLAMNPALKANPDHLSIGDHVLVPDEAGTTGSLRQVERDLPEATTSNASVRSDANDWLSVPRGQVTFDAEGREQPGSRYHSRVPHVPSASSGVTIGRGYDMKLRSRDGIVADLRQAGLSQTMARRFAACAGYKGSSARRQLEERGLAEASITLAQQYRLFLDVYDELAADVIRICRKADVVARYGATVWEQLDPRVRDTAVDLRFRGDYTPATRERVQPLLVSGDASAMGRLMADQDYWCGRFGVPKDRFNRRKRYLA